MSRRKSLFSKYLSISLSIVLISFLILGTMLVYFVAQYSETQKKASLSENTQVVSDLIATESTIWNNTLSITKAQMNTLRNVITTISTSMDADIFVTRIDGELTGATIFCSEGTYCTHLQHIVPPEICNEVLTQESGLFFTSTLGDVYTEKRLVAAKPILVDTGQEIVPVGIVFSTTSEGAFTDFTSQILKIFFLAAISTFVIVFCITGFFTYNMVRPLRQMSQAAKSFAKGDFTIRVPVTSSDEIGELSVAFNNMADALAASEGTRRSFIANVSHELKTPMTTIAGFIDGILDGTIPKDKQNHYLKIVTAEVRRLSRLVTSMLSLSRIDSGDLKMHKQRFDMTNIIISTLLTFEQKLSMRHINVLGLEDSESVFVEGDPDMIHQVVYNLLENAVKFTEENGIIEINTQVLPTRVTVEIKNSGPGIPPDELHHIFERFYKTDKSRSQDKNGMGLGLYIVKTIMRLHGGDITAKSVQNEFSSFKFWLPKDKTKERKAKSGTDSTPAIDKMNDRMIYVDAEIVDAEHADTGEETEILDAEIIDTNTDTALNNDTRKDTEDEQSQ